MQKPDNQQILVFDDFTEKGDHAVLHGLNLAKIFNREMTLVHIISPDKKNKKGIDELLMQANDLLKNKASGLEKEWSIPVRVVVWTENVFKQMDKLIDEHNGIIAVTGIHHEKEKVFFNAKNILKMFRNARIPYVIADASPGKDLYKKLVLPVNYYIENKEKALWASYFGRFHSSEISIIHTSFRDKGYKVLQESILKFIRQFFNEFCLNYTLHHTGNIPVSIDRFALTYAREINAGIIIVMTTLEYAFDDYLFGPPEKKILQEISGVPVMFINPRKDLYCMCD